MSTHAAQKPRVSARRQISEGPPRRLLLWGTRPGVERLAHLLEQYPRRGWRASIAFSTDGPPAIPAHIDVLDAPPDADAIRDREVDGIVFAFPPSALRPAPPPGIRAWEGRDLVVLWDRQVPVELLDPHEEPAVREPGPGARITKRILDLSIALPAVVLTLPFVALLAAIIRLDSPGTPFFAQERIGWRGKVFRLWKLRSMVESAPGGGPALTEPQDERITRIGRFLRRWRLDELPQLWNVLRGEMSLVGPRPEQPEIFEDFMQDLPQLEHRLAATPGMTGWAQVRYGYVSTPGEMRQKFGYDLYYLRHRSLSLDLQILIRTLGVVLSGRGVR